MNGFWNLLVGLFQLHISSIDTVLKIHSFVGNTRRIDLTETIDMQVRYVESLVIDSYRF